MLGKRRSNGPKASHCTKRLRSPTLCLTLRVRGHPVELFLALQTERSATLSHVTGQGRNTPLFTFITRQSSRFSLSLFPLNFVTMGLQLFRSFLRPQIFPLPSPAVLQATLLPRLFSSAPDVSQQHPPRTTPVDSPSPVSSSIGDISRSASQPSRKREHAKHTKPSQWNRHLHKEFHAPPSKTIEQHVAEGASYVVRRTPSAQLPIYRRYSMGGKKIITLVKKIEGNKVLMLAHLVSKLNQSKALARVNPYTGNIELKVRRQLVSKRE